MKKNLLIILQIKKELYILNIIYKYKRLKMIIENECFLSNAYSLMKDFLSYKLSLKVNNKKRFDFKF